MPFILTTADGSTHVYEVEADAREMARELRRRGEVATVCETEIVSHSVSWPICVNTLPRDEPTCACYGPCERTNPNAGACAGGVIATCEVCGRSDDHDHPEEWGPPCTCTDARECGCCGCGPCEAHQPTCGQLSGRCECGLPTCEPTPLPCYVCTREAGGDVFGPDDTHPKRRVVRTFVVEAHRDPTEAYVLECGHTII